MKARIKQWLLFGAAVLLILSLVTGAGLIVRRAFMDIRQREAETILFHYNKNILLQLQGKLNEADTLAQMAQAADGDLTWFDSAAQSLLERDEVLYVSLIQGDKVVRALPEADYGSQVGWDLQDFSYIYTLSKVVKELVVEGPVVLEQDPQGREVFLFLQPFLDGDAYLGQAVVALERDYVMEQLGLFDIVEQGYDYELWRVDSQSGGKEVVSVSRSEVDFSFAAKTSFYLPTQWNLSVQPTNGWMTPAQTGLLVSVCLLCAILLLGHLYALRKLSVQRRVLDHLAQTDPQTELYNRAGFTGALDGWLSEPGPILLFYFVFADYEQISQLVGPQEELIYLHSIPEQIKDYIRSPYLAGRLGSGCFAVAVREDMDDIQRKDFAKGLSLELIASATSSPPGTSARPSIPAARRRRPCPSSFTPTSPSWLRSLRPGC